MRIIAPCFYPTPAPADLLVKSAAHHGLSVKLYGVGEPFQAHGAHAQVARLYEELQGEVDGYTLVTDCRDVLFLASEDEIMRKFASFDSLLVMSAEKECWPPNQEVWDGMPRKGTGYDFVNAGQYIGETCYIRHCLKHLLDNYRFKLDGMDNSQPWWPLALVRGELDFQLDNWCEIFQTMSGGAVVEVGGRKVLNKETLSLPSTIHFNGCCGNDEPYKDMYRRIYGES